MALDAGLVDCGEGDKWMVGASSGIVGEVLRLLLGCWGGYVLGWVGMRISRL